MFDLNTIVNAAITEAVNARITEVLAQHANIVGALAERIATLEKNEEYLVKRIAVLEDNPAQGVETMAAPAIDKDALIEHLNDQEWFWSKLRNFADAAAEAMMNDHLESYDHDDYDSHISDDDKHFEGDIEDAVRDAVSNMSFEVSVS